MNLSPSGRVCICPGEQTHVLFTCQVSVHNNASMPGIDWLIQFEATDQPAVHQSYISGDPLGDIKTNSRNGYNFTFNLTYSGSSTSLLPFLTSTLIITITRSRFNTIHRATIDCNQEQNEEASTVLQICIDNHLANYNNSTFILIFFIGTPPSSPINSRQDASNPSDNVSVVASNCASNLSTSVTEIMIGN